MRDAMTRTWRRLAFVVALAAWAFASFVPLSTEAQDPPIPEYEYDVLPGIQPGLGGAPRSKLLALARTLGA